MDTTKCASCSKIEAEHIYIDGQPFHVFVDAETQARRIRAAREFNERARKAYDRLHA